MKIKNNIKSTVSDGNPVFLINVKKNQKSGNTKSINLDLTWRN